LIKQNILYYILNYIYIYSTGSAYIYSTDGFEWSFQTKLIIKDSQKDDKFGFDMKISHMDNTLAITCPYDDDKGLSSGN
jgi:hypothetical protein